MRRNKEDYILWETLTSLEHEDGEISYHGESALGLSVILWVGKNRVGFCPIKESNWKWRNLSPKEIDLFNFTQQSDPRRKEQVDWDSLLKVKAKSSEALALVGTSTSGEYDVKIFSNTVTGDLDVTFGKGKDMYVIRRLKDDEVEKAHTLFSTLPIYVKSGPKREE